MQGDELSLKYKRVPTEEAEQGWNEVYEASLDSCMHGMYCLLTLTASTSKSFDKSPQGSVKI